MKQSRGSLLNLSLITIQRYWPFQWLPYSCSIQAFYYYCCGYTSIVCLMAISVNRLIGITMPTYYEKGYGFYNLRFLLEQTIHKSLSKTIESFFKTKS